MTDIAPGLPRPIHRITWLDLAVGLGTAALQLAGTSLFVRLSGSDRALDPLAVALLVGSGLPLVVRDRWPLPVLVLVSAAAIGYALLGYPTGFYTIALVFAIWAAVAAGHRLVSIGVIAVLIATLAVAALVVPTGHARDPGAAVWFGGWLVAAFVLGEVSRGRRSYLEQVERRAWHAERTREEEALRRAGEERLRIARELHDVLTHHIAVINVQAGVAVHLLDKAPGGVEPGEPMARARDALVTITESSRQAMRELRGILGVLRRVDEAEPRSPTPGLDALGELVERAAGTGLEVAVETAGARRPLPVGIDLAAYRIIQEALTNVTRHAEAEHVTVWLSYGEEDLELEISDDGLGAADTGVTGALRAGNGLTGMRERAAAVGGSLEAGSRPEGGFRVRARLPVAAGA